jgi:hypothetical protein
MIKSSVPDVSGASWLAHEPISSDFSRFQPAFKLTRREKNIGRFSLKIV